MYKMNFWLCVIVKNIWKTLKQQYNKKLNQSAILSATPSSPVLIANPQYSRLRPSVVWYEEAHALLRLVL